MKVFISGGTGFVGRAMIRHLQADHQLKALVRKSGALDDFPAVEQIVGDLTDIASYTEALSGCDAVINLVGIIREFPQRGITFERLHTEATAKLVRAAQQQSVPRYLQMSANGTRADAVSRYHQTKWAAEELVRQSGLDWTIFRPSLIYGPGDAFVNMLAGLIRLLPVVPVMGDGSYQLQPVHVDDIGASFCAALSLPESIGQSYCCCGNERYSYDQLLDIIGAALGKTKLRKWHQPLSLMQPLVRVLQHLPQFPMTRDQLTMLLEGNICATSDWQQMFSLAPRSFQQSIDSYLA